MSSLTSHLLIITIKQLVRLSLTKVDLLRVVKFLFVLLLPSVPLLLPQFLHLRLYKHHCLLRLVQYSFQHLHLNHSQRNWLLSELCLLMSQLPSPTSSLISPPLNISMLPPAQLPSSKVANH